jgi:hypothetical protein
MAGKYQRLDLQTAQLVQGRGEVTEWIDVRTGSLVNDRDDSGCRRRSDANLFVTKTPPEMIAQVKRLIRFSSRVHVRSGPT